MSKLLAALTAAVAADAITRWRRTRALNALYWQEHYATLDRDGWHAETTGQLEIICGQLGELVGYAHDDYMLNREGPAS